MQPKYAQLEIERRWLVKAADIPSLQGARARKIEDKYLSGGRLRLRKVSSIDDAPLFKLGKKYLRTGNEPESVVSVYLTESEYQSMLGLPGRVAVKTRYSVAGGSLDVYEPPTQSPAIFEIEFEGTEAATEYTPPTFVSQEVTYNERLSGFALAEAPGLSV